MGILLSKIGSSAGSSAHVEISRSFVCKLPKNRKLRKRVGILDIVCLYYKSPLPVEGCPSKLLASKMVQPCGDDGINKTKYTTISVGLDAVVYG